MVLASVLGLACLIPWIAGCAHPADPASPRDGGSRPPSQSSGTGDAASGVSDDRDAGRGRVRPAPTVYRIRPGDLLHVEVYQEPDISRDFRVRPEGTINHPLLGRIAVESHTAAEVEADLTERLGRDYLVNPRVLVTVVQTAERRVIVLGEVKSPGDYAIGTDEEITLLQAVARAGGFSDIAALDKVRIVRTVGDRESTIRVNVTEVLSGQGRARDIVLRPGDVIIVPQTIF